MQKLLPNRTESLGWELIKEDGLYQEGNTSNSSSTGSYIDSHTPTEQTKGRLTPQVYTVLFILNCETASTKPQTESNKQ